MSAEIEPGETNAVAIASVSDKDQNGDNRDENYAVEIAEESREQNSLPRKKKNDRQEVGVEEEETPLKYCRFVANHHRLAFGIALGSHIFMILVTVVLIVAKYDVLPVDFTGVPLDLKEDSTKLRTDAWLHVKKDKAVVELNGNQKLRSAEYQAISLIYKKDGGNVFTKENLLQQKKFEDELFNDPKYQKKLCQLEYDGKTKNASCKRPLSILRFFDGSYAGINPNLNDPTFDNIPNVLRAAQTKSLSNAILTFHLGKNAVIGQDEVRSDLTRSLIYTGWPISGYASKDDRNEVQAKEINKIIVDVFATKLDNSYKDGVGSVSFFYNNLALFVNAIEKQVIFDMLLAVASFAFIFVFVWFQTGSLWITWWGIFGIISSFNITNLVYRVIFDYKYIGIFHVLSIFIILGIGSDNIFVFMDTWKQSQSEDFKNLEMRLTSVYKRAAKATFITSFTTMMAFLSNVQSPLLGVSSFGLFSAILVIVNYMSVILFFPTVIMMHHRDRQGRCCCGPIYCRGKEETRSANDVTEHQEKKTISQRITNFFQGPYFEYVIIHKVVRWFVIAGFVVLVAVSIAFATKLEPDKEEINFWRSDTNWGRVTELSKNAFRSSQEDKVIVVHIVWGLNKQDRSECHHTDYKCKGKTVFDRSFDLNPPPCQNAVLNLCKKIKNLPAEEIDKLKLRKSQVTGEIEIKCIFKRMNEYLSDESKKKKYPNGSDFSFPLNSPKIRALMGHNQQLFNVTLPDTYYRFFEVGLGYFITQGGADNFADSYDFAKYQDMFGGQIDPSSITKQVSIQGNKYGNRLLYVAIAVNTTLNPLTLGYQKGLPIYDSWEAFVSREMKEMPLSCSNGFQATVTVDNEWHWLKVQRILVKSAIIGIGIGISLALVVLTLATTNVIVGVMATVTIALVTCGVLGLISIIGWKLGVFESLNLTLVVGLAVDYVVHLAEGYMALNDQDRVTRVKYALGHVGISVFSGACTTLGSSIFTFAAKIIFFSQFGIFIFCTIGLSILYSMVLFTTVLAIIGPEGEVGSLRPVGKGIYNYIRGFTKEHKDCKTCKGKGFHKIDSRVQNTSM